MKVEVEEKIEVTMKMNLRELKMMRTALVTRLLVRGSNPEVVQMYHEIDTALKGQEKKA